MFDFEKLIVYQKVRAFNKELHISVLNKKMDRNTYTQLDRAATSIMLNIAEGSARFTNRDKKNFYIISRGSLLECIAVLQKLLDLDLIEKAIYESLYGLLKRSRRCFLK
jgi:four helix bundle protein